jgi:hypothetical protein
MNKKNIILFLIIGFLFYFLAIAQISFFSLFEFFLFKINFSLLLFFLICFFEESNKILSFFCAFWTGLFLDIFSSSYFFGFFTILLMVSAVVIKLFLYRYVKIPSWQWLSKIQG